jgi:restriction system protein
MFVGTHTLKIDERGRFRLPRGLREALPGGDPRLVATVAANQRYALAIYPLNLWSTIERKIMGLSSLEPAAKRLQRLVVGHAIDTTIDRDGMLSIDPDLLSVVEIKDRAVLQGRGERLAMWNAEFWPGAQNSPDAAVHPEVEPPDVLLQAVIVPGDRTSEGILIESIALPWYDIVKLMLANPRTIYELDWRKWEELIAGAYKREGYEVILTPRSNDKGRDVIATRPGIGSVRFFDQMKAYKPGHLVTSNDVLAMAGVLAVEKNVSKGIITTTSDFAPGVRNDPRLTSLMPYRLELKARDELLSWLKTLAGSRKK